jgi:hypothetical protein
MTFASPNTDNSGSSLNHEVGEIITAIAPPSNKYLACDGGMVSTTDYPEYCAIATKQSTVYTPFIDGLGSNLDSFISWINNSYTEIVSLDGTKFYGINKNILYYSTDLSLPDKFWRPVPNIPSGIQKIRVYGGKAILLYSNGIMSTTDFVTFTNVCNFNTLSKTINSTISTVSHYMLDGTKIILIYNNGSGTQQGATSSDGGTTWFYSNIGPGASIGSFTKTGSHYILFLSNNNSTNSAFWSLDGYTWTAVDNSAYGNPSYNMFCCDGSFIYYQNSSDYSWGYLDTNAVYTPIATPAPGWTNGSMALCDNSTGTGQLIFISSSNIYLYTKSSNTWATITKPANIATMYYSNASVLWRCIFVGSYGVRLWMPGSDSTGGDYTTLLKSVAAASGSYPFYYGILFTNIGTLTTGNWVDSTTCSGYVQTNNASLEDCICLGPNNTTYEFVINNSYGMMYTYGPGTTGFSRTIITGISTTGALAQSVARKVIYESGLFIAFMYSIGTAGTNTYTWALMTSPDGITWTWRYTYPTSDQPLLNGSYTANLTGNGSGSVIAAPSHTHNITIPNNNCVVSLDGGLTWTLYRVPISCAVCHYGLWFIWPNLLTSTTVGMGTPAKGRSLVQTLSSVGSTYTGSYPEHPAHIWKYEGSIYYWKGQNNNSSNMQGIVTVLDTNGNQTSTFPASDIMNRVFYANYGPTIYNYNYYTGLKPIRNLYNNDVIVKAVSNTTAPYNAGLYIIKYGITMEPLLGMNIANPAYSATICSNGYLGSSLAFWVNQNVKTLPIGDSKYSYVRVKK